MKRRSLWLGLWVVLVAGVFASPVAAQQGGRIELEVIEIESEVPRRVAQFFVQRDRLHYQPIDDQPSFLPDLLKSVEEDPF
jgi:hypothetical protein